MFGCDCLTAHEICTFPVVPQVRESSFSTRAYPPAHAAVICIPVYCHIGTISEPRNMRYITCIWSLARGFSILSTEGILPTADSASDSRHFRGRIPDVFWKVNPVIRSSYNDSSAFSSRWSRDSGTDPCPKRATYSDQYIRKDSSWVDWQFWEIHIDSVTCSSVFATVACLPHGSIADWRGVCVSAVKPNDCVTIWLVHECKIWNEILVLW